MKTLRVSWIILLLLVIPWTMVFGEPATYNAQTQTLHIPCLNLGDYYWIDLQYRSPYFEIATYGLGKNQDSCASFDTKTLVMHVPDLDLGKSYWIDLFMQSTNPIGFVLSDFGENIQKTMKITSSAFNDGDPIPSKYTCDGANISPPLSISNVPNNTKSLAMIMEDPDAPSGVWVHWVLWNIASTTTSFEEGKVPTDAVQGVNSGGQNNYFGPCPPPGSPHRYFFRLYALDTTLTLSQTSNASALSVAMNGHIIATAELMGTYKK